ncbi:nucleotide-diphospho-sugar transferase [Cyathus striatus]|nr:nucleotide-diphospho-sugar transferase [Cyathus striatus]
MQSYIKRLDDCADELSTVRPMNGINGPSYVRPCSSGGPLVTARVSPSSFPTTAYRYTETQDWFSHNIPHWSNLLPLVTASSPRALEIGSWEGRSAVYLLTSLCKKEGGMICIDHFDLLTTEAGRARREKVQHNLALTGGKYRIMEQFSVPALMSLLQEEMGNCNPGFDWIYIDGSHEADDTFLDGELCWRLARKGAIVIFDDYHWDNEPEDSIHHPKKGIDAFLELHRGEYDRLTAKEHYQVVLRKTTDMRIGFLVASSQPNAGKVDDVKEALGYGTNVALAVDSKYAMAAAVVIRSAVERTPGRITFYVVDCGLSAGDKEKLKLTLPEGRTDTTLKFLDLPDGALATELGPSWAKLDILHILPVERCLYLDSDVLVCKSLKELWDTDLEGNPIGACVDIGHPMGHAEVDRRPYFNAGVMLLDLALIRRDISTMPDAARSMRTSTFRDQDVLTCHFTTWKALSLTWNAQGLGTYAVYPSSDRKSLNLDEMLDPAIVHFTGPVHPSLAEILNPYVQPPTAKPWGYAGSPGHPFERAWWDVLEKTAWNGVSESDEWKRGLHEEKLKVVERAGKEFNKKLRELGKL